MNNQKGFSLTEILIATVILAVLAAVAIPAFTKTREKAIAHQAIAYLRAIRVGEKIYRVKNGMYLGGLTSVAALKTNFGVEVTTDNLSFNVTATNNTFTATATKVDDASTFTLDHAGNWTASSALEKYKPAS